MSSSAIRSPASLRRPDQGQPHLVGLVVRRAIGLMVEVVKLTDRGDSGRHHLAIGGQGQRVVGVGIESFGNGVHLLAPGPERAPLPLRATAQSAMERMRVAVGEAREAQTRDVDPGEVVGVGSDRR